MYELSVMVGERMKMFKCPRCKCVADAAHSDKDGTFLLCMFCGHELNRERDVIESDDENGG